MTNFQAGLNGPDVLPELQRRAHVLQAAGRSRRLGGVRQASLGLGSADALSRSGHTSASHSSKYAGVPIKLLWTSNPRVEFAIYITTNAQFLHFVFQKLLFDIMITTLHLHSASLILPILTKL